MSALSRWQEKLAGFGLWIEPAWSEGVVKSGSVAALNTFIPDPAPDFLLLKFGGDWGGLWGGPPEWGNLSPKSQNPPGLKIVPYLYVVPGHNDQLIPAILGLLNDGYPAVVLDAEMEWAGREPDLRSLITALNPSQNLIGVTGYAWFDGWPDHGAAFGQAIGDLDIVYLPQAYQGAGWKFVGSFWKAVELELSHVVPNLPRVYAVDAVAVDNGFCQDVLTQGAITYWYESTVMQARWRLFRCLITQQPSGGGIIGGSALAELVNVAIPDIESAAARVAALGKQVSG